MGNTGVIDNFLGVFTSYIDSGFGLLGGEVAFIATTLIVIDVTLAALFWAWGADDDIIARLVKKTLFVGVFAYIISNWNNLARIVFESFAGLGLMASGTGFSVTDLMRPDRVAQTGLDAGRPLLDSISDLMGWIAFFENFIQIACLLFAWALVVLAFFNSVFSTILLIAVGVPYALFIGVMAFFITLIPLIGTVITTCIMTVIALFVSPLSGIIVLIAMLVYMQVEAYVMTPKVMGKAVQVPGTIVLISALAGGTLLGLLGALVAIPISAGILLIIREVVVPKQARS